MQFEPSTTLALLGIVFAAGGAYKTVKSAASQGRRIGRLEEKVARLEGRLMGARARTLPQGVPISTEDSDQ